VGGGEGKYTIQWENTELGGVKRGQDFEKHGLRRRNKPKPENS